MGKAKCLLLPLLLAWSGFAFTQTAHSAGHANVPQVLDYWAAHVERQMIAVADAMPADKYAFAPTDGEFKGVRTFAQQLKHAAATNFILGATILGENPPADAGDETGPDSLRTKADVTQYLKDSFVYLHKAIASMNDGNATAPIESSPISPLKSNRSATRLGIAVEVMLHTYDHYGQLVEYLRMNGIVPPASRLDGPNSAVQDK